MFRSHTCGELRPSHIGNEVTLAGWVQRSRELGGMTFLDLRDRYGITQLAFNLEDNAELCAQAGKLGREFVIQVTGKVIDGKKLGKTIGYPTANIVLDDHDKLIPANGIYAVRVMHLNTIYNGMLNIGNNPTIENAKWSIEVNIFDFDKTIYGDELTIYFIARMRDEVKFGNLAELKTQLKVDESVAKRILSENEIV